MSRNTVMVHVGQAGVQTGNAIWELFCLEHGIYADGRLACDQGYAPADKGCGSLFKENYSGKYVPRALFIDTEPTVIDEIRTGSYRALFHPDNLITGEGDAADIFARGYYGLGSVRYDRFVDVHRRTVEECDYLQGFIMNRSVCGGTGSGLGSYLMEIYREYFGKTIIFTIEGIPSERIHTSTIEPYNAILSSHMGFPHTTLSAMYDNEAMYDICDRMLNVKRPTYTNVNRILAQAISVMTSSARFGGSSPVSMTEFAANLCPFPRLHFPIIAYAPFISCDNAMHTRADTGDLVRALFNPANQFVKCRSQYGAYISSVFIGRGDVSGGDVNNTFARFRNDRGSGALRFIDWLPPAIKVGLTETTPVIVPGGDMCNSSRACVGLLNNTAIVNVIERIRRKYKRLLKCKLFLHHYLNEGMEIADFDEALYHMSALEHNYRELYEPKDAAATAKATDYPKQGALKIKTTTDLRNRPPNNPPKPAPQPQLVVKGVPLAKKEIQQNPQPGPSKKK